MERSIPSFDEFISYAKTLGAYTPAMDHAIEAKYNAWVADKWKDGHGKVITNWKTKLQNTMVYMPGASTSKVSVNKSSINQSRDEAAKILNV